MKTTSLGVVCWSKSFSPRSLSGVQGQDARADGFGAESVFLDAERADTSLRFNPDKPDKIASPRMASTSIPAIEAWEISEKRGAFLSVAASIASCVIEGGVASFRERRAQTLWASPFPSTANHTTAAVEPKTWPANSAG